MIDEYKIKDGESELEYKFRIYGMKDQIGTWYDVADVINNQLGTNYTECRYRKEYKAFKDIFDANQSKLINAPERINDIAEKEFELRKERQRLMDERRSYNAAARNEARSERFEALMVEAANKIAEQKPLLEKIVPCGKVSMNEAVVFFSDWHYGMCTKNIFNVFNKEICAKRVDQFVNECIERINLHNSSKIHIVLMGDCAHGAIHTSARVESDELVCDQLMNAAELIAEAINKIWAYTECDDITIYSVYGNHLRTVQNKSDSVHADNMERIIPWWLKQRFKDIPSIKIYPDITYEFTIVKAMNSNIACVHGDLDDIKHIGTMSHTIFSKMYGENIDYTVSADKHHIEVFDNLGIESSIVGSLCGTDGFANGRRLYSRPSQTLMIFNERGKDAVYNIVLD